MKILIIEDERLLAGSIKDLLEIQGLRPRLYMTEKPVLHMQAPGFMI